MKLYDVIVIKTIILQQQGSMAGLILEKMAVKDLNTHQKDVQGEKNK